MKLLKEYKTALEKEIDEYMTRDVQTRRRTNQTEDNQADTDERTWGGAIVKNAYI